MSDRGSRGGRLLECHALHKADMCKIQNLVHNQQLVKSIQTVWEVSPHAFEGAGLIKQKTCPVQLSTRDRESNSRCQLHVLCQSQPRRVLSKISQLNWFANREQRPPFNKNCEDGQALRRPGLRGSLNLAQRWEVPFAWKWCPSTLISLSQPRIRQHLSIIGTAFLCLVAEHRSVPSLPLRFLDRSSILVRVASFWGDVIQVVPRVLKSDSHSLCHCHQLVLVLAARLCQEEELQIQHLSPGGPPVDSSWHLSQQLVQSPHQPL